MNKAILYTRVSSKAQEQDGYSLDAQEKLGYEYALKKGFAICKSWKVSESAWKQDREAFSEMLEYAKRNEKVKHIIFDVTDRMTRNDYDKIRIYTLIREYNKTIHFSRNNKIIDKASGSDDEFMLDIEVAVAKKMSNDISKKTSMGLLEKAEQGFYPSFAPIGYINNKVTKLIDLDHETAHLIRQCFELYATGNYSLESLRHEMRHRGLESSSKSKIAHVLHNPFYYGGFIWLGKLYMGSHKPIISKELFDKVQQLLTGKPLIHKQKHLFHFNNLITCGECGCKVIGERKTKTSGKVYDYYHCTFSKGRHGSNKYYKNSYIEKQFENIVESVTLPEDMADWIAQGIKEISKDRFRVQEVKIKRLKGELALLNARLSKLYDMKLDGEIEDGMFKSKEAEFKSTIAELTIAVSYAEKENRDYFETGRQTLELSKRLHKQYVRADGINKAIILRFIASNYTLNDASLSPAMRKPFSIFAKGLSRTIWLLG
ncbi:MAG: recombinase family protein [Candidatus Theseobacter exili]|nr:recombinase family protein [Candidatus Theseobacter exili]